MKITTTTLLTILFPFFLLGQQCDFFPLDTANVCGYEYDLLFALDEGTITHGCENDQYFSINYATNETNLSFSSCGTYEIIYNATDGSCVDTLIIQVSDPNSTIINKSTDITLDYGDIDCPGSITADCYSNAGISIPLGSGPPTPVWSFCSTSTCQTSIYTSDTIGITNGCLADSILLETFTTSSSSEYCSDDFQDAFIVLDSEGETVTDNTFLDYIAQLQDTTNLGCSFLGLECSFTNTSTCYDSIAMDTTFLPIPVRIGGQWTMPMIDTLQLSDTTYFNYSGLDYELILAPGVEHYGPEDLIVNLNEIYISNSNDTTRQYPNDFYLMLQWEEEWITDTIQIITEKQFDTDDDCFACGGFSSANSFNVPEIPDFPCGPVSIYYPSICECEYDEPNYSIQMLQCDPRMWQFELISSNHYIGNVYGATADISLNTAILSSPTNINIEIESYDYYGCMYYHSIYIDGYIWDFYAINNEDLSCETPSVSITAFGDTHLANGSFDVSSTVWSSGQTGSSISVSTEGSYTATFTDAQGCTYTSTVYVNYDDTIDCFDENPLADTECNMDEFDIICDIMTFDSFNYLMPSQNSGGSQPFGLCDQGAPNNMSWFSFVAYSGDYSLNITPTNCTYSTNGQQGIQVGLYSDCTFSNSPFCSGEGTLDNIEIPMQDLVEGQVYHMFIDGFGGSICNYEIDVLGDPEPPSLAPQSMTLSSNGDYVQNANAGVTQEYCLGSSVQSQLTGVEIQGEYFWSINTIEGEPYSGDPSEITEDNDLTLTFNNEGTYEVCIDEISNGCDLYTWTGQVCFSVKINHTEDEDFGLHYVCEGEIIDFESSILDDIDPNEDGIKGLQISQLNYLNGENSIIVYDNNGCEYTQKFELELLAFSENLSIQSDCSVAGVTLDFDEYFNDIAIDEDMTIDIIDPNGQLLDTDISQDNYIIPYGSADGAYTVLISKTKGDVTCDRAIEIEFTFSEMEPASPQITNGPMALCSTEGQVTYIATNEDPEVDFEWSVDGDISTFTISGDHNQNISIDWKEIGGNLTVTAINDCGLQKSSSNDILIYNSPEIAITNEEETCNNNEAVIIIDIDEDLIETYTWDFNGASIISGTGLGTHSLIWNTSGPKEISLAITDIYGCDQKIESEIIVNESPVADFTVNTDSICVSESVTIEVALFAEGTTQNWEFEGGINIGTDNPIILFDSPGWKSISLAINNGTCTSEKVSRSIYVEARMEEVEINCLNQGLHSLEWEWNHVPGADGYIVTVGNQPPVTITTNYFTAEQLLENTEYDIQISVLTNHKCPPPAAQTTCTTKECKSLEFTFDIPDMICIEDNMDMIPLISTVPGIDEGVTWSGENVTASTFDPNGLTSGVYQIEVRHELEQCVNSAIIEITLLSPPEFEVTYDETICFGEESTVLKFSISSEEYSIMIDGELADPISKISPGAHDIVVMDNDMCSAYQSIFIAESEESYITIDGDLDIKEGEEHAYSIDGTLNSDIDLTTLIWSINGIEYCSGSECLSISPDLKLDSEIELNALNQEGCEVSTSIRVEVEILEPELVIPNIFSPNNDGVNDFWFVIPNKDDIKIETVKIIDRWNNMVYSQDTKSSNTDMRWDGRMNGMDLQPGVYVYAIRFSTKNASETVYGDITIIK